MKESLLESDFINEEKKEKKIRISHHTARNEHGIPDDSM